MAVETVQREADPPQEFDTYSLVLLSRPADAPKLDEDEANHLQRLHLGHLATMREQGTMLVAGPFSEQWDVTMRGLCLYQVDLEEARRLAELDPAVQRGWFKIEVMRWWTAKGAIRFP